MQAVTTIGLDIAKSVFQVHGINAEDNVIIRRQTAVINAIRVAPESGELHVAEVHDTSTAQYGPIVMKTDAELEQTHAELRNGTFIKQRDQ